MTIVYMTIVSSVEIHLSFNFNYKLLIVGLLQ